MGNQITMTSISKTMKVVVLAVCITTQVLGTDLSLIKRLEREETRATHGRHLLEHKVGSDSFTLRGEEIKAVTENLRELANRSKHFKNCERKFKNLKLFWKDIVCVAQSDGTLLGMRETTDVTALTDKHYKETTMEGKAILEHICVKRSQRFRYLKEYGNAIFEVIQSDAANNVKQMLHQLAQ